MSTDYKVEIGSPYLSLNEKQKLALARNLKRELGAEIEFSREPTTRVLEDIMVGAATTIGTVAVSNPDLLIELIRLLSDQEGIFIKRILDPDGGPLLTVEINISILKDANIEWNVFKKISDNKTLVQPANDEAEKELARLIDEHRESGQPFQPQPPLRLSSLEKDDEDEDTE